MKYLATSINNSATISEKAGAKADYRGKAVKYDASGNVVLCSTAGEAALGIGILTNDEETAIGADVDIQVKEMGVAIAGGAVAKGDALAVNASAQLVKATAGNFVLATAMQAATAAGEIIKIQITKYATAAASSGGGGD